MVLGWLLLAAVLVTMTLLVILPLAVNNNNNTMTHRTTITTTTTPPQRKTTTNTIVTLTTVPDRLGTNVQRKYLQTLLQREGHLFDKLLISVPFTFGRTGEPYHVPRWMRENDKVHIHRCLDHGPLTKILGAVEAIDDDETWIVVLDDDLLYRDGCVRDLLAAKRRGEVHCHNVYADAHWTDGRFNLLLPGGYSGCVADRRTFARVREMPLAAECRFIDDHWLAWAYDRLGIPLRQIRPHVPWNTSLERDVNPGWSALKSDTDRAVLQRGCRERLTKFDRYHDTQKPRTLSTKNQA